MQELLALASDKLKKLKISKDGSSKPSKKRTSSSSKKASRAPTKIRVPSFAAVQESPFLSTAYRMGLVEIKEKAVASNLLVDKNRDVVPREEMGVPEVERVAETPLETAHEGESRVLPLSDLDTNRDVVHFAGSRVVSMPDTSRAPATYDDPFGFSGRKPIDENENPMYRDGVKRAGPVIDAAQRRFLVDHGLPMEDEDHELAEALQLLRFEIRDHRVRRLQSEPASYRSA